MESRTWRMVRKAVEGRKPEAKGWIGMVLAVALLFAGCGAPEGNSRDLMQEQGKRESSVQTEENNGEREKQHTGENPAEQFPYNGDASGAFADFGVKLLQNQLEEEGNILVSPLSVLSALAMTANGARGETLAQMEQVFGISLEELNPFVGDLLKELPDTDQCSLKVANAIWFREADFFQVEQSFLDRNKAYYGAGLYQAPFDDTTLEEINTWVEEHTDGMVKDILDEIPEEEIMYLVNALAFDGEWQDIYFDFQIREGEFTLEDGSIKTVDMMRSEEHTYLEDDHASGFLKYYKDGKYAFGALLPEEGLSVEEYAASLTGERLGEILSQRTETIVWARVPKFESEYSTELGETLARMGMENAFDNRVADFSGIGHSDRGNLSISRVLHKTYIAVDERGTRAGAATLVATEDGGGAMDPGQIKEVYLDRPFLYMLVECESGLPVFMGIVREP